MTSAVGYVNFSGFTMLSADCLPPVIVSKVGLNDVDSVAVSDVFVQPGQGNDVILSPNVTDDDSNSWSWAGPNEFTSTDREVTITDVDYTDLGAYEVIYTSSCGAEKGLIFSIGYGLPNDGTLYRAVDTVSVGVDVAVQSEGTSDVGGGDNMGYIDAGDIMNYEINIPTAGDYLIHYRVANNSGADGQYSFTLEGSPSALETVTFANTGGWQNWITSTTGVPVSLEAGTKTVNITPLTGKNNFNWFRIVPASVWQGDISDDWANAGNWAEDAVPTALDHVLIPDVATDPMISSDVEINSLTINEGASLTTASESLTVASEVLVNGSLIVNAGASLLTFFTSADKATLDSLLVGDSPVVGFDPLITLYDIELPEGTLSPDTLRAVATESVDSLVYMDVKQVPGVSSVKVISADSSTMITYAVNFTVISNDAGLTDLAIDGTTVDGFNTTVLSYDIELAAGTTTVPTVTATAKDGATAVVTAASGLPGSTTIVVTAGESTRTYVINFTVKVLATDATLSDLTVDGTTVTGFDAATTSYTIELAAGTTTVPTVAATASDANASVSIADASDLSGMTVITVTAEDGSTVKTYELSFTVLSDDATLSDLTVDGTTVSGFDSGTLTYTVTLEAGTTAVPTVDASTADTNATYVVNEASDLSSATTVVVTAQDGTTETYTINFTVEELELSTKLVDFEIYPNPTYGVIKFNGLDKNVTEASVIRLSGKSIVRPVVNNQIDISELRKGIYFIKVGDLDLIKIIKR